MRVSVAFRLFDEAGALVDEISAREPLTYVHGYAQVLPGLEAGLDGARIGERRTLVLGPDDAFGARDPAALLEIDPDDFPDVAGAEVGAEIVATGPDGTEAVHRIVEIDEDAIMVDLNHPLAGQTVRFEVEICDVHPATDAELDAAQADLGVRIAHAGMVVYGSQSDETGSEPEVVQPLVQLRTRNSNPCSERDESRGKR